MTSTSFNTGYSLSRNSSKVIQPPGGQTADIFGSRSEAGYSSASSQAGSDVASSRVTVETIDQPQQIGHVSPNGSISSGVTSSGASSLAQQATLPLLMADDFKPNQLTPEQLQLQHQQQLQQQQGQQQQPMNIQHQKLIQMQQLQQNADANRSPKKTIPVLRRNPITGEIIENPGNRQPAVVRVRQPPGGRSSGIF